MTKRVRLMILSGLEDGALYEYSSVNDGEYQAEHWKLSIGRRDDSDICLRNDTFISRLHAKLHWKDAAWWLEDCNSTNGTFKERVDDYFNDERVKGIMPLDPGQLFRIGRTWIRLQDGAGDE